VTIDADSDGAFPNLTLDFCFPADGQTVTDFDFVLI